MIEVMTGEQMAKWRALGEALGMKFDEIGHPYREGEEYELDGTTLHKLYDWNPLDDDGDAFRLQYHYGLSYEVVSYGVFVRNREGRMVKWKGWGGDKSPAQRWLADQDAEFKATPDDGYDDLPVGAKLAVVRAALFEAAFLVMTNTYSGAKA